MKRRFTLSMVLVLMLLAAAVTVPITYEYTRRTLNAQLTERSLGEQKMAKLLEIARYIEDYFVGPWDEETMMDSAGRGMVDGLGDRWSHYLSADEYIAYENDGKNQTVGIGIIASGNAAGDALLVNEVYADSPAEEVGLRPHDEIITVDGVSVAELGYYMAVDRMRGAENTRVSLTVRRPSDGKVFDVLTYRRTVMVEAVRSEILADGIGYVRVRNFHARVDDDFKLAIERLLEAEVKGIVFDMRFNPGGDLNVLVNMLDVLLPGDDVIITLRNKAGVEDVRRATGEGVDLPMAVLINEDSYSAAEFFAAALKEYDRAVLAGEKTVGKGYSQYVTKLTDDSALLLSTNEYFTPKGVSLAGVGLTPDILVEADPAESISFYSGDHEKDAQLQAALQALKPAA